MRTYRRGVYKFLCVHGYIILVPLCTMLDRANSNVKLASSSRVEVLERSSRVRVLERSSTSTSAGVLEGRSSSEARVRVLEFHTLKLASKSARTRRSRLSSA